MTTAVLKAAADYFNVTVADLLGRSRFAEHTRPRFAVFHILRERDGMSTTQIGKRLNRDHSTVISGLVRAKAMIPVDPELADFIEAQMALPRYSRSAVEVVNIHRLVEALPEPEGRTDWSKAAPIITPEPKQWERVKMATCHDFLIDEDGFTVTDHQTRRNMVKGSHALATAILRELAA